MVSTIVKVLLLALVVALAYGPPSSQAVPIVYVATLEPGVPAPGVTLQPNGNQNNPVGAQYYNFHATAGTPVTVFGDRLDGGYDMSFWLFAGTFADTNAFGASFDTGDPGFIGFGDDEDPPNISGPFGDPRSVFIAPTTGFYTAAVTNFLSNTPPPHVFELTAEGINNVNPVPEPVSLALLGTGLAGLVGYSYRRRKKSA